MTGDQNWQTLDEQAQFAKKGSMMDRRSQIPYIVRSVAHIRPNRNNILFSWHEAPPLVPFGSLTKPWGKAPLVFEGV
jgi:hypothetical protein